MSKQNLRLCCQKPTKNSPRNPVDGESERSREVEIPMNPGFGEEREGNSRCYRTDKAQHRKQNIIFSLSSVFLCTFEERLSREEGTNGLPYDSACKIQGHLHFGLNNLIRSSGLKKTLN